MKATITTTRPSSREMTVGRPGASSRYCGKRVKSASRPHLRPTSQPHQVLDLAQLSLVSRVMVNCTLNRSGATMRLPRSNVKPMAFVVQRASSSFLALVPATAGPETERIGKSCQQLFADRGTFSGNSPRDDLTYCCTRRRPRQTPHSNSAAKLFPRLTVPQVGCHKRLERKTGTELKVVIVSSDYSWNEPDDSPTTGLRRLSSPC